MSLSFFPSLNNFIQKFKGQHTTLLLLIASSISILTLIGWYFDFEPLRQPFPDMVAMNPMTALLFVLTSSCLYLVGQVKLKVYPIIYSLAFLIILFSGLKLISLTEIYNFGVDQWLFPKKIKMPNLNFSGNVMASPTAINFFLIGIAILLVIKQKILALHTLALVICAISLLAFISYLFRVPANNTSVLYYPMAIPTAISFFCLGVALLLISGNRGFIANITNSLGGGKVARLLLPTAILVPIILGGLRLIGETMGLYSTNYGIALQTTSSILVFTLLIWRTVYLINKTSKELVMEISERKRVEQELKANHLFLDTILENIPNMIFVKDGQDLRFLKINQAGESLFGKSRHSILGKCDHDFFSRDQANEFASTDRQVLVTGITLEVEEKAILPSGIRWLRTKKIPIKDENGLPLYLIGISEDITESKQHLENISQLNRELEEKVTERTRELSLSESKFRALIENSIDGIIVLDSALTIIYQSPAVERIIGFEKEESLGKKGLDFIQGEEIDYAINIVNKARQTPSIALPFQFRIKHRTGYYLWIEGTIVNLLHVAGIQGFVFNFRDITLKKLAKFKLEEQNRKMTDILESITDGFYSANHDFIITYWNPEAERILKMPRERVLGRKIWDCFPEAVNHNFYNEFNRVVAEKISVRMEEYYEPLQIWVDLSIYPTEDGFSVYFKDVTERKQTTEEIRLAKERYDIVAKATNETIWDWDLNTNKIVWSQGFGQLVGFEHTQPEQQEFSFWKKHVHPEDRARVLKSVYEVVQSIEKVHWQDEYRYFRADGTMVYVSARGAVIRNKQGKTIRMIGSMQDITEKKKHELEREGLIQELTQTNKDLQHFAFIVSHNFRAPLANLLGLVYLMKGIPIEDPMLVKLVEGFDSSAHHLNETINDLNQILVIKESTTIPQKEVKIQEILFRVLSQIDNIVNDEVPEIILNTEAAPAITFNQAYLESIFLNLMTNAVKYRSAERPLKIQIATAWESNCIILTFQDNGIGLDLKRYKDRIFGLYQRFHNNSNGKGLGLYLIKSQVEALGGEITCESEVDTGATFKIKFKNQRRDVSS